jgi:HAD superfamily hydrolase (TIGR01458 family)
VTNTTSRPRSAIAEKLDRFGVPSAPREILTPPVAAAEWIRRNEAGPVALFVPQKTKADFAGLPQIAPRAETGARYVVVGDLGASWDFATLNRAFRLLHSARNCELIALGMTRYWRSADGVSLDVAPFIAALEHATGKTARVLGKPAKEFFAAACALLACAPKELLMIGDDIRADIAGAQAAGIRAVLVRTGKYHDTDIGHSIRPDAVIDSVSSLPRVLRD